MHPRRTQVASPLVQPSQLGPGLQSAKPARARRRGAVRESLQLGGHAPPEVCCPHSPQLGGCAPRSRPKRVGPSQCIVPARHPQEGSRHVALLKVGGAPVRPRGREREERVSRVREVRVRPPLQTLATVPAEWLTRGRGVALREAYTCRDARRARHVRLHAACQAPGGAGRLGALCGCQTDCLLPITERARPMGPCVLCRA